ncbi:hypothetical protein [Pseudidiomarina sediminum]|uniref:hypothetical protein n=1 Tax=Pseudidiomarina sediminum TaxID=431675 RepID=UPI001C9850E7|nr:hypothetical protein [Pseudidiomarina sediminum]MBY6062728.1 hypothetical protein [Pseudidiomarina sediminum]
MIRRTLAPFYFTFAAAVLSVPCAVAQNTSVPLQAVDNYALDLEPALAVQMIPLAPVLATVRAAAGQPLQIPQPFENVAIQLHVSDGTSIAAQTHVATLQGPAVEHFFHRYQLLSEQYSVAQRQYQSKRKLYAQQAISANDWQQFLTEYLRLSDTMHELEVLRQQYQQVNDDTAHYFAPNAGIWRISNQTGQLGSLLPTSQLRLAIQVATHDAETIEAIQLEEQQLPILARDHASTNGLVTLWSAVPKNTAWPLQQTLNVQPLTALSNSYRVAASAITTINAQTVVFEQHGEQLRVVPVTLVSLVDNHYFVTATSDIQGRIATASVAALKGQLESEEQD